jgi:hypothetical protein
MNNRVFPALIGGVLMGILSLIPILNMCCFLWAIIGGVVAVYLYKQKSINPLNLGEGSLMGAFAGAVGGGIYLVITVVIMTLFGGLSLMGQNQLGGAEVLASFGPTILGLISGIIGLVILTICAAIGGLIAAAIFQNNSSNQTQPPPPPPPFYGQSGGNYGA